MSGPGAVRPTRGGAAARPLPAAGEERVATVPAAARAPGGAGDAGERGAARARARRTAYAIAPGVLIAGIGGGMAFPILPLVGLDAGLSLPFIGVILAANRFGRVVSNPFVGAAVDRVGGRRVFLVGLVLQVAVLLLYVLGVVTGHPGPFFLAGRLLHGPGSSCVFVSSQTLALDAGGAEHKGLTSGIVRAAQAAGVPAGLVLGGVFAGLVGPAGAFALAAAVPLVAVAVGGRMIPDLRLEGARRAPRLRESLATLGDARIGAVAAVSFGTTLAAQGVILTTLALIVRERGITIGGLSAQTASGVFMAAMVASMIASTPLAGRLSDLPGRRAVLVGIGLALTAAGLLATAAASGAASLAAGLALVGFGTGTLGPPLLALLGDLTPPGRRGSGVAALQLSGDLGGTLGPLLGTVLLARSDRMAYAGCAALLVLLLPVAGWLGIVERRPVPGAEGAATR